MTMTIADNIADTDNSQAAVPAVPPTPAMPPLPVKRTYKLALPYGPLFVDHWEPAPANAATTASAAAPPPTPPVLLLHGWGGSGSYWRGTAQALAATTRVLVPDLPGTGRSQPVRRACNMADYVDAVIIMLDSLEIERVQVIGHSMGGAVALLVADKRPDLIERLVLTSVSFFVNDAQVQLYRSVMTAFRASMSLRGKWMARLPGVTQMMASRYFYRIPKDEALLRQGLQEYLELDAGTATATADDAPSPRIPQAGARIRVPTLLIACRQDQVMPVENVNFTARTIPGCQVHWIEECGHIPMVEKPAEFMALVRGFLVLD